MSDLLASYTSLPNLHPALVHFPIVLLPLAVLFDLVAVCCRGQRFWDRLAAVFYALGAAAAAWAVRAGEQAADTLADVPAAAQPAIADHSDAAHLTLYLFAALAAARLFLWWKDRIGEGMSWLPARWAIWVAGALGLVQLAAVADQGGGLVYHWGLGVKAPQQLTRQLLEASPGSSPPSGGLEVDEHGVRRWIPLAGDIEALGTVLEPAPGYSRELVSVLVATTPGEGLGLAIDGRTLLVLAQEFGDVQVDAALDLTAFVGKAGVAHHVRDQESRAHFAIGPRGSAELIDLRQGRRAVLDEKSIEPVRRVATLSVSSAGSHLKGMVDGRTVTHGHIAPGEPGKVGLLLDGSGTVRVLSLTVTPLGGD